MINFCTLFDSHYISRGLALYESLCRHCGDFRIYIFAFDNQCAGALATLNLENATVITLEEFEDEELLALKPTRTRAEYCWTCTPSTILYALDKLKLESVTYLDADIYFYDSPGPLLEEMGDDSILITEHRYSPRYDRSQKSGRYCVQFMTFRNDLRARIALDWWRNACNEWCYARYEEGKFGDQKYLDDWPRKFEGVHVLEHLGGGVAPWNVQQYEIFKKGEKLFGREFRSRAEFNLIFYHFHPLKFYAGGKIDLGGYRLSEDVKKLIYGPYIERLEQIKNKILTIDRTLPVHGETEPGPADLKNLFRYAKHKLISNILHKAAFTKS